MSVKNIGERIRRLGVTMQEFGGAFEQGATQDLRIELPSEGGVHLTGLDPKPTAGAGLSLGGLAEASPLLLLALAGAVFWAATRG